MNHGKHGVEPIDILLVEDNAGDARLAQEALRDARIRNRLDIVRDGVEALAFLKREGAWAHAPRPDLILLDINLPRKNGFEVLDEVKRDPALQAIPVVILTTSEAETDVLRAYEKFASCYITKPVDMEQFMKVIQSIEHFWLTIVRLPPVP